MQEANATNSLECWMMVGGRLKPKAVHVIWNAFLITRISANRDAWFLRRGRHRALARSSERKPKIRHNASGAEGPREEAMPPVSGVGCICFRPCRYFELCRLVIWPCSERSCCFCRNCGKRIERCGRHQQRERERTGPGGVPGGTWLPCPGRKRPSAPQDLSFLSNINDSHSTGIDNFHFYQTDT